MLAGAKRLCSLALALLAALCARDARADVGGGLGLVSDYRFRGVSLSAGEPAVQGHIDWSSAAGLFAGAFASSVRTQSNDSSAELQAYLGYFATPRSGLTWSAGAIGYLLPSMNGGGSDTYAELFGRFGWNDMQLGVFVSNDYFGSGARSAYLGWSLGHELRERISLVVHVGLLATGEPSAAYGDAHSLRRADARFGLVFDLRSVLLELSATGAWANRTPCSVQAHACDPTVVIGIRKEF